MFDEGADLLGRGEEHRGAVALHSRRHQGRLARERSGTAGIRFETEVCLPEIGGFPIHRRHVVSVAAVADRLDLAIDPQLPEILKPRGDCSPCWMAGARRLKKRDYVGALTCVRYPRENHAVLR